MCVIPTEKIRRRMRGGFDYYAAPDCNVLCSSGSGTPKANGTQECSCSEIKKITITSGSYIYEDVIPEYGYERGLCGSLSSTQYRGQTITYFYSTTKGNNKGTYLTFQKAPNDVSEIKVRVNGIVYTLQHVKKMYWQCSEVIFSKTGTYVVEFLN